MPQHFKFHLICVKMFSGPSSCALISSQNRDAKLPKYILLNGELLFILLLSPFQVTLTSYLAPSIYPASSLNLSPRLYSLAIPRIKPRLP